jgi:hypothetical protein
VKYNVTLVDPPSYKYAYLATDTCRVIAHSLRSLGHVCDLTTNNVDASAINIIVGGHLLTEVDSNRIVEAGIQHIIHQSEVLTPGTGNFKVVSSFLGERFEPVCRRLFETALKIWDGVPANQDALRLLDIQPDRFKWFRQGFHEALIDVKHRPWVEKDIDVLFMGSVNQRRAAILNEMAKTMRVVAVLDAPAAFRNDLIARAKVNLSARSWDTSNHLEALRVTYLLNNRCVILCETADTHHHLQELIVTTTYDQLVVRCREILAEGPAALEDRAAIGFEGYKLMPMTAFLPELLN